MSKNKRKSKKINSYTQYPDTTQIILEPLKKLHCSSESVSANSRPSLLNFKLANISTHKSAVDYFNIEEYIDSMDLKNRTKCAANSQFDPPNLIRMTNFPYDSDNNVELGQGDNLKNDEQELSFNHIINSNSEGYVDSSNKHTSDKINVYEWNYNELGHKVKFTDRNERTDNIKSEYTFKSEVKNPGFLVMEYLESQEKVTNAPEYRSHQQTQIKQKTYKYESENINKVEYVYFDKSESDDEHEDDDKIKRKKIDKMDYVQVPMYEMEKPLVKDKSKLKTNH